MIGQLYKHTSIRRSSKSFNRVVRKAEGLLFLKLIRGDSEQALYRYEERDVNIFIDNFLGVGYNDFKLTG